MSTRVLVIDDNAMLRRIIRGILESSGYDVRELGISTHAEAAVIDFQPHLVLSDLMMPDRDGLDVFRGLRAHPRTRDVPLVLITAKNFEGDKRAALEAGVAGYLVKPFEPAALLQLIHQVLARHVRVRVWGCRGSVAAPDRALGKYGGNTSCVEVLMPENQRLIFDAGTGIRMLGNQILSESPIRTALLLTHYHWDHIQGLPFFKPLYVAGNEVHIYGPAESNDALTAKIQREMGGDYFPISIEAFRAAVRFVGIREQSFDCLGVPISTLYMMHPGRTLGYRLESGGTSVVFAPDNELFPESVRPELCDEALRLACFASGASLLIHDATYSDAAYPSKRGWGHSSGTNLARVAAAAGVKKVLLFHHDPDNDDPEVEVIHREFQEEIARLGAAVESEPAREGASYEV